MQAPFADPLSGLEVQQKILPLVGRESELQVLRLLLDTVAHDRPTGARALTISGEAGVGKTRLLAELYAEAQGRGFRVLEGRAYEAESLFPYLPFIEALRPALRATPLAQLRRYAGLVEMGRPARPDNGELGENVSLVGTPLVVALARLFPELPQALGVTITPEVLSPDQEKFRLLDAIATFLERMALERPVLLGIDNLQWADSASLELTMYLTVRLHTTPVALVGVTRPPGTGTRGDEEREVIAKTAMVAAKMLRDLMLQGLLLFLPVGSLNSEAAAQHLHALLPGTLSQSLAQTLLKRAEGNPFFLEELVRMLTINRQLVLRDGTWRATQVIDSALPASITQAVEQRLQALSAPCRELLRVAALFGRTFPLDALAKAMDEREERIQALVQEAKQAGVIAKSPEVGTVWDEFADEVAGNEIDEKYPRVFFNQSAMLRPLEPAAAGYQGPNDALRFISTSYLTPPTHMFCQGIVQEVLSAEVLPHRARALHGAIGSALEAIYAQTAPAHAAELARHYVQSGDTASALYWSTIAGEDAARQQAHREAIGHFRLVLKLLETGVQLEASTRKMSALPTPAQLHIAIGESWFKLGELEQAQQAFQQALEQWRVGTRSVETRGGIEEKPPPLLIAQANRLLADVYRMQAKYDLALAHLQSARAALDGAAGEGSAATTVYWFPGRSFPGSSSQTMLGRAGTAERILLLQAQATVEMFLNRAQEAEEALWQSHQLATEIGDRGSQAFALHMVGWLRGWGERIHEAIRLQEQAHDLYVAIGDPFRAALGDQGLGIIYQALGEMERARLHTLRGFERARRYGVRRILGWLHWNQGVMALVTGDWTGSETHLQQALQEATSNNDARLKPVIMQAQAELNFRRGNWTEAERLFQLCIQAANSTEWLPGSLALYGHFLAVTGRRAAARAQLDRAAAHPEPPGFGGHFYIPFLADGYLHLGADEQATTYIERIRPLRGFMYYGNSVDRILGVVATQAGEWEEAEQAFEEGLALCRRAGNQPEEAAIYYEQARAALLRSGNKQERSLQVPRQVHDLCERARTLFTRYEMQRAAALVDTLQEGIRKLEQREETVASVHPRAQRIRLEQHPGYQLELTLTKRELEVLHLVAEGHTDREVADTLIISPRTVNRHLSNIFVKLDVPGRAAAVALAVRQGLV